MKGLLSTEILTKTFDDLPHGVGIFQVPDLNDIKTIRYVFMNKVLLYEMRKTREEVFGKKIIEVAPEAYEHEGGLHVIETYRRIAKEGGSTNLGLVKYSNHMVAGTYECSIHHIQNNYVYVMLRNVTELERTKNELELKNKDLNQLTYIASHDLKAPLNNISCLIELIKQDYQEKLDEQGFKLLGFINDASKRMKNLINDLLDYGSLGHEKEVSIVDCNKLIQDVLHDIQADIKETRTTIEVGDLPTVKGFPTELRLLFQNLISNGIKYRKNGVAPIIKISAKKQDGWTFSVQDNGIGIAENQKDKIFIIFQRLHTQKEYAGTGIGLAHCKKIIDLHKGDIWVDSKPEQGSIFYFTIPN